MSEGKCTCMMFTIVQTLCDSIKNYFNISYEESMNLLYHSKLYKALEKKKQKCGIIVIMICSECF